MLDMLLDPYPSTSVFEGLAAKSMLLMVGGFTEDRLRHLDDHL